MTTMVILAGSPSASSKASALIDLMRGRCAAEGIAIEPILVRDLPAQDLIHARADSPAIQAAQGQVAAAAGVVVITPVYKAAYTGVLKTFLDLLPPNALAGKIALPVAMGAAPLHYLALDYALKPVLAALGVTHFTSSVYLTDNQFQTVDGAIILDATAVERFTHAVDEAIRFVTVK